MTTTISSTDNNGRTIPPQSGTVVPEQGSVAHILATGANTPLPAMPEDACEVINEGDEPFTARYLTRMYSLPPGGRTILPWEVMVNFLGNPYAVNAPGRMDRQLFYKHLRVKYGAYDDDSAWETNKPRLAAYSLSTGERYKTVVDDPEGSTLHAAVTSMADQAAIQAQMAAMESRMKVLQQMLMDNAGGSVVESDVAPPMPGAGQTPAPSLIIPPSQNPHGVFDSPPPGAVPAVPATGAVEDTP